MLIEMCSPDFVFEDERGKLTQLVHEGFKQMNVIFSRQGIRRGNHYHKENREVFYVISGELRLYVTDGERVEEYLFRNGDMFLIPPFIIHSFIYRKDTWLASMYDLGVEQADGKKDIYTELGGIE